MPTIQLLRLKCDHQANGGGDSVRMLRIDRPDDAGDPGTRIWGRATPLFRTDDDPPTDLPEWLTVESGTVIELKEMIHGKSLGRQTIPDNRHPQLRDGGRLAKFDRHSTAHYSLAYEVVVDQAEGGGDSDDECDDSMGCTELDLADEPPELTAARGAGDSDEPQQLVVQCADDAELALWPRWLVLDKRYFTWETFRKADGTEGRRKKYKLSLYNPDAATPRERLRQLDRADERRWYNACVPSARDITDPSTWGAKLEFDLPCCSLDHSGSGTTLTRDAGTWHWQVFGWSAAQPGWAQYLVRTLRLMPLQHLEATRMHTLIFDFRVRTYGLGRAGRTIGKGGVNWQNEWESRYGANAPAYIRPTVLIAYAALNQTWYVRARPRPSTGAEIDNWYSTANFASDTTRVQGTIHHEFGHIFNPEGKSAEMGARGLWARFRDAINYQGSTTGPGEGFSESYRIRMMGRQKRGAVASQVDTYLDNNLKLRIDGNLKGAMPTLESVRSVQGEIAAHPLNPAEYGLLG